MILSLKKNATFGIAFILAVFLLLINAFYNGFPLIFNSDTAMYMEAAYIGQVQPDRPIGYGLFMLLMKMEYSLWIVVFTQAIFVSSVLLFYFTNLSSSEQAIDVKKRILFFIGYVGLISLFMGASFEVSWLMVDIYTPLSILTFGIILFISKINFLQALLISALSILSICMHNTNIIICSGLLLSICFGYFSPSLRMVYKEIGLRASKLIWMLCLLILSYLTLATTNYHYGGGFTATKGGPIFLMGNMVEMGLIDQYLSDQCAEKKYDICKYRDSIPNNFIWDGRSPIYKTGGWKGSEPEYKTIVMDILTTPKYLKTFIFSSIIMTAKQFFHFETGEAAKPTRRINMAMRDMQYDEYRAFKSGRQAKGTLNYTLINFIQSILVGISLFIYIAVFSLKKLPIRYRAFMAFILLSAIINAWLCGTFSGVFPRYQSRIVWLLPLPLFLYAIERNIIKYFRDIIKTVCLRSKS